MRSTSKLPDINAFSITLLYILFACLWILLSDSFLDWMISDSHLLSQIQTFKGLLFVAVTGILLYLLIRISNKKISFEKNSIDKALEAANMAAWSVDLKTGKSIQSKKDYELFGLKEPPVEWTLQKFLDSIHNEDKEFVSQQLQDSVENDIDYNVEYRNVWPDGSVHWMYSRGTIQKNENGLPTHLIGIVADITGQKKLEEDFRKKSELFERIFENIPVMINIYNPDLDQVRVNKRFEEILGWTNEELVEQDLLEIFYPDIDLRNFVLNLMTKADGKWHEFEVLSKDKGKRIQRWVNFKLTDESTVGIGLDITEQKNLEQKLEEERTELQKSKERYQKAEEIAHIGHWQRNLITDEAIWSDGFYNVIELERGKRGTSFKDLLEMIHKDDRKSFQKAFLKAAETGKFNFHYRLHKQKSGEIGYYHELGKVEYDEKGNAISISGTIQEVTETVRSQLELQKSQQLLHKTFESLEECVIILDYETKTIIDCNRHTERIFGHNKGELLGKTKEMLHQNENTYKKFTEHSEKALSETGVYNSEFIMKNKNGDFFPTEHTVTLVYNDNNKPDLIVSVVRDITELKEAENQLKREKLRFELVANTSSDVIWDYNLIDKTIWWSDGFEKYFGYKRKNIPADISSWTNHVHPDDLERVNKSLESILDSDKDNWFEEYRFLRADGSVAFIDDHGVIIRNKEGEAIQMVGILNDITERKQAKEKLQESEQKYRHLFKQNPQPMWIYDPRDLKFKEVNDAAIHHYGYSEKEFLSMKISDIRPKEDVPHLIKTIGNYSNEKEASYMTEWVHLKKDGSKINVSISSSDIQYENSTCRIVLATDITEQKKAKERVVSSLVEGENRERKRLAQELHDGLGQYLAAANMNLDAMKDSVSGLNEKRYKQFHKGLNFLKHAITENRSISHNLMPRAVEDYGLPIALEALVDNYKKSTDITFYYFQNVGKTEIENEVAINIYRIVQEALSNAVKYSEADKINLQLIKDNVDLILTIDDNGQGFDSKAPDFKPGLGLQTMKTRTDAISGSLEIETGPGRGTLLNVIVPIGANTNTT